MNQPHLKRTILIVDDTTENLDILNNILSNKYKVKAAKSGKTALKIAMTGNPPDIILLDIMMPEMDGFEVCSLFRKNKKTKDIPIIFLTAKTDYDSIVKGFQFGGQDYVTKPFHPEELLARISTHLELKEKKELLIQINKSLEDKVAERTKELKKANNQLLRLDKAKSRFLDLISHELRTPLNGIVGFTEILEEMLGSTEYISYIELLKSSIERLENFSKKAILITELQLNRIVAKKTPCNISAIVNDTLKDIRSKYAFDNQRININITPQLTVNADHTLMKKCMVNILDNALKYSPEDSQIQINSILKEDSTIIAITDEGPGFSEDAMHYLFSFFALGEDPIDLNFGLSLAETKLIMEAHSGSIEVINQSPKGARVELILPNR